MAWQVESYSIEHDDSDPSLIRIIYGDKVGWVEALPKLAMEDQIRILDHYFRMFTGNLHFDRSVSRFFQIIEDSSTQLLIDSFQSYLTEMNEEEVREALEKERMLLVVRLWMIHQLMLDDEKLNRMSVQEFLFSILEESVRRIPTIIADYRSDVNSFIKHYVFT